MRRIQLRWLGLPLVVALSLLVVACGGPRNDDEDDYDVSGKGKSTTSKSGTTVALKPVQGTYDGVIEGKVVWDGAEPAVDDETAKLRAKMIQDKDYCLTGKGPETEQYEYR